MEEVAQMKTMRLGVVVALLFAAPTGAWDSGQPGAPQFPGAPLLGPPTLNAYGPGINSDATGRPFQYETQDNQPVTGESVRPNAYGPGIGMDAYGRPVQARPWP